MEYAVDQVITELKALRKGHGIESAEIGTRVGHALRRLSGANDDAPGVVVRRKVREFLLDVIGRCHPDQEELLFEAFGLVESAPPRRYEQRMQDVADRAQVDPRTVKRRVDEALKRVAELAIEPARAEQGTVPWHTTELQVALAFDLAVPEVFEIRRVRAEQDDVREIELGMTLTPPPGWSGDGIEDLGVDLIYGGELRDRKMKARNRIGFTLALSAPLARGDEHQYALRVKLPAERGIAPHYVCTPRFRCDRFELRVRFGAAVPGRVWRLAGVPPLELEDPVWAREVVAVDRCGEVRTAFERLEPQLSYGLGWDGGVVS